MKKKLIVMLSVIAVVTMAVLPCTAAAETELSYDDLKGEYEKLKIKYDTLENSYEELTEEIALLKESLGIGKTAAPEEKSVSEGQFKDEYFEVTDSGWGIHTFSDGAEYYASYGIKIKNLTDQTAQLPVVHITIRDDAEKILASEEQYLMGIAANDEIAWSGDISCGGTQPASVEFSVSCDNFTNSDMVSSKDFEITNTSEIPDMFSAKYTGELTNLSNSDIGSIAITVLYLDNGEIVGGTTGFISSGAKAGQQVAFDVLALFDPPTHTDYEVFAQNWS